MWALRAVLIAIVIIVVIAFAYYNLAIDQRVEISFGPLHQPNQVDVPLLTVVFWSFAAGVLLSLVLFVSTYIRLSVQMRSAKKKIKALDNEVLVLRNRPIEESADLLKGADRPGNEIGSAFTEE